MQGIISAVTVGIPATKVVCKPKKVVRETSLPSPKSINVGGGCDWLSRMGDMDRQTVYICNILSEEKPILKDMPIVT